MPQDMDHTFFTYSYDNSDRLHGRGLEGIHGATFNIWSRTGPLNSRTLLINAHGYQTPTKVLNNLFQKNYVYTVAFNEALYNPTFKNNPQNLAEHVQTFKDNCQDFRSYVPDAYLCPFYFDATWITAFDNFRIAYNGCDVASFYDLSGGNGIRLYNFLEARHWNRPGRIVDQYDNIFLLTCRTNITLSGLGMGGGQQSFSRGLFNVNPGTVPTIPTQQVHRH